MSLFSVTNLEGNLMRKLASIREVSAIDAIPGADKIEVATVDGWKCVIRKGEFAVGDTVIYCEIDSFLPIRDEFEFLRKSSFKQMGDEEGFRLRTVKLRGQVSQGLLLPVSLLKRDTLPGEDVTAELGIQKYEPPVPACLTGEVIGPFPTAIQKTDEERIQNLAAEYTDYCGKAFYVSEKLDGTSLTAFFDGEFGVCGRNWQYAESAGNSYWQIVNRLELPRKLAGLGRRIAIQGELIGPGIQGNRYKLKQQELFVFNVFDLETFAYVDKTEAVKLCASLELQMVPMIEQRVVPESIDGILALAEGKSVLCDQAEREGLVWVHGSGANRISFKTISNRFLAKEV